MKRIVIAAILLASPASAGNSVLSCFAQSNNQHVVIMGAGNDVRLQWGGGEFYYGTAEMQEDRFFVVKQFGNKGTFRLVYDTNNGAAYGGTIFYDGKKNETPFNCVWQ